MLWQLFGAVRPKTEKKQKKSIMIYLEFLAEEPGVKNGKEENQS